MAVALPLLAVAASIGAVLLGLRGADEFAPGACERLEPYLRSHIVGQDLALRQLADAVCDHLANDNPTKPLVVSVHGPPGVGKSLTHLLAARALYNTHPEAASQCPGRDCPGYKVLYGLDYTEAERDAQLGALRHSLEDHVAAYPQALLVVEEYDKLDCAARGFLRHWLEGSATSNASLARSIVMLESNTGYTLLYKMLVKAKNRSKISPEAAQRALKDMVFERWASAGCEERADTLKTVGLVDFFLPYLPLERAHIAQAVRLALQRRAEALRAVDGAALAWDEAVVDFLARRVDCEGDFPIEGAKEVGTLMTRYVTRALREWRHDSLEQHAMAWAQPGSAKPAKQKWQSAKALRGATARLEVMPDGTALHARAMPASLAIGLTAS